VPASSTSYRVKDGDDWFSVAKIAGMDAWTLIRFNYPTLPASTSQAALEVNWYLENYVGCKLLTADRKNYCFSSSANPGIVYVPGAQTPAPQPAPQPQPVQLNYWRFDIALRFMYDEMHNNSRGPEVAAMRVGNSLTTGAAGKVAALAAWAALVQSGGRWDHKKDLRRMLMLVKGDMHFPFRGDTQHEYYYDIWSNVHYGYVGRAAWFTATELQMGHQVGGIAGRTDPFDVETVQLGIDLWNQYGINMTKQQLHQELLARSPKLQQIQQSAPYKAVNPNSLHIEGITNGQ